MSEIYLVCNKNGYMLNDKKQFCTMSRQYEVINVTEDKIQDEYAIIDDNGAKHWFSTDSNSSTYYGRWFYMTLKMYLPSQYDHQSLKNVLYNSIIWLPTPELREQASKLYEQMK